MITTQPPGAKVTIDGKPAGETPLTVDTLKPGRHAILVVTDAEGRKTIHTQVHDSGEVVDLARWMAGRTGFPLKSFDVLLTDRWPPRG